MGSLRKKLRRLSTVGSQSFNRETGQLKREKRVALLRPPVFYYLTADSSLSLATIFAPPLTMFE